MVKPLGTTMTSKPNFYYIVYDMIFIINKAFGIGDLGFGCENGVAEEVFGIRNKVYIFFICYFIILNIKFII